MEAERWGDARARLPERARLEVCPVCGAKWTDRSLVYWDADRGGYVCVEHAAGFGRYDDTRR